MNKLLHRELVGAPLAAPFDETDLLARHDYYFETSAADTPALIETAHALRYQVYCLERKFEDAEEHRDGLERDEFDTQAIHGLLIHRPSRDAIGTVRLILPSGGEDTLPVMHLLRENNFDLNDYIPVKNAVEVSRFAISKGFRRRASDQPQPADAPTPQFRSERERTGSLPCLSLIQFLLRQSVDRGVTYWAAVMEVRLLRMLAAMGIHFTPLGPLVFHHGLRQPCYCNVPEMLDVMSREQKDFWRVITNGGELAERMRRSAIAPVAAA